MPDKRIHRGPHPEDQRLFAPSAWPALQGAARDLCWLLSRGYASPSSLKLVGDRFGLDQRQRTAVMRCACSDQASRHRRDHRIEPAELRGRELLVDGYNMLTTVEAALAGGVVLLGRDGCFRDMASMHGTWRRVDESLPALRLVARKSSELGLAACRWLLDEPVSNSGRLRAIILELAAEHGLPWKVDVVPDPDPLLAAGDHTVATADSAILDRCARWVNLTREIVETLVPEAWVVPVCPAGAG